MGTLLKITSESLPGDTEAISLLGREAISEVYHFEIGLRTQEGFDAAAAVRQTVTLDINTDDDKGYPIHGYVAAVELLHQHESWFYYRLTVVPRLWELSMSEHSRIFTDNTVIEIIEAVLTNGGIASADFSIQVAGSYDKMEHVCQYKESDLEFISRWMEKEGLYYFFDHSGSNEKLIIVDDISLQNNLGGESLVY